MRQNKTARTSKLFLKRSTARTAKLLFKAAKLLEMKESAKVPQGSGELAAAPVQSCKFRLFQDPLENPNRPFKI